RLLSASSEDQSAIGNTFGSAPNTIPSAPLTPAQQQLARELTEALVRAAAAPATTSADWPLQISPDAPDNLYAGNLPEIAPLKLLAGIATHHADALPAAQAIPIYAAVGQLSRQQRQGLYLIQQFNGMNIEDEALVAVSRRLADLDPESLAALARAWAQLQPVPDSRRALENERDQGFANIVEAILRPTLLELLRPADDDADTAAADDATVTFTRHLRLSGLIDYGERSITLENTVTSERFTVSAARATADIQLVKIDFEHREAIIRRGRREAVVQLESKQITERAFAPMKEPVKTLDYMLRLGTRDWDKRRSAWLDRVRTHPGGIEGYIDEVTMLHDSWHDLVLRSANSAKYSSLPATPDDPICQITCATGPIVRTFRGSITRADMFQAAIQHRLRQLGQAATAPVPDPWSDKQEPFAYEPTPDGGFLLRSRYEVRADKPLTYKFAAPDAGFQSK
ncbi:MAG: hypothetical protein RIQ79_2036, partial [Verrucomicrobiota bacterium]